MTFNLPLAVRDHAPPTLAKIDEEIDQMLTRVAVLVKQRTEVETHLRLQEAFDRTGS